MHKIRVNFNTSSSRFLPGKQYYIGRASYIEGAETWITWTEFLTPEIFQKYLVFKSLEEEGRPFEVEIDYEYRDLELKDGKPRAAIFTKKFIRKENDEKLQLFQDFVECIKTTEGISYTISEEKLLRDVRVNELDGGISYGKTLNVKVPESISRREFEKANAFKKRIIENHSSVIREIAHDAYDRTDDNFRGERMFTVSKTGMSPSMLNPKLFSEYGMADLQDIYQIAGIVYATWEYLLERDHFLHFSYLFNETAEVTFKPKQKEIQAW